MVLEAAGDALPMSARRRALALPLPAAAAALPVAAARPLAGRPADAAGRDPTCRPAAPALASVRLPPSFVRPALALLADLLPAFTLPCGMQGAKTIPCCLRLCPCHSPADWGPHRMQRKQSLRRAPRNLAKILHGQDAFVVPYGHPHPERVVVRVEYVLAVARACKPHVHEVGCHPVLAVQPVVLG